MECFVCDHKSWKQLHGVLVKCKNCNFVRASSKFYRAEAHNLYGPSYFSGGDYWDYDYEKQALKENFKNRLNAVLSYKRKGRLLEIGCAYGFFLQLAQKHFEVTGIDLNNSITKIARKNSRKAKILTGDFLKKRLPSSYYDVVCLLDVVEHLKRPDMFIKKVYKIMRNSSLLIIETGDIESLLARLQGKNWRLITPPMHLNYFSKRTLSMLIRKYGFEPVEISYVGFVRTLGQIMFRLTRNLKFLNKSSFLRKKVSLNTKDILFMVSRKIG